MFIGGGGGGGGRGGRRETLTKRLPCKIFKIFIDKNYRLCGHQNSSNCKKISCTGHDKLCIPPA